MMVIIIINTGSMNNGNFDNINNGIITKFIPISLNHGILNQ